MSFWLCLRYDATEVVFLISNIAVRCAIQVYLAVHVTSNPLEEEAVVISIGEQSFTVNVPRLGVTSRMFIDRIPDVVATFNDVDTTLHLKASSTVTHEWNEATIKVLAKVLVRCTAAKKTGPIEIELEFLRPK